MNNVKMFYHDRRDVSDDIDANKAWNCMPKSVFYYYYWSFSDKVFTFQPNSCIGCHDVLPYSEWALLGLLTDSGVGAVAGAKRHSVSMMKLGTVIPYLKKIKKIYESRDTHPEFC